MGWRLRPPSGRTCSSTIQPTRSVATMTDPDFSTAPLDVVVIGAGVAGMYAMHRLREQGLRVHGFEAGSGVGGTWYFNRSAGARCAVASFG